MRILFCNKYNYPFSGTEVYLFELMDRMRAQGHEVALFSMADPRGKPTRHDRYLVPPIDFKQSCGWREKLKRASHAIYSREARRRIRGMIAAFRPDVAHVRNIYHHLSPSILWELKAHGIPVVYHLNDFKLLCPSYNLVSEGKACEACKSGAFWHALKSRCYPGLGSRLTLTLEAYVHRFLGTYRKCVDLFLAPSQFVRDKFIEHGWDRSKFQVLQHFQEQAVPTPAPPQAPLLYVGRLSAEKGVDDLLHAMQQLPNEQLVVAGDGPERERLERLAGSLRLVNAKFIGYVGTAERDSLIAKSGFTVFPSHAYETLGKTILESYAQGRAVVASDMGSRRELVRDGETGLLYPVGDTNALAAAIRMLGARPQLRESMGQAGLRMVQESHKPDEHCAKLISVYERLIKAKAKAESALVPTREDPPWQRSLQRAAASRKEIVFPAPEKLKLRIAFIGGRGVISKYSGIETYYEEVGKRLAERGHEVTIYCRNYFTPPQRANYDGMRLLRLPTIRSKHLETVVHTLLSTAHALTQSYDIVHFHALGPALFSCIPKALGVKTAVTVQGLDWQRKKWGRVAAAVLRLGERASVKFPDATMVVSRALRRRYEEAHGARTYYVPNGGLLRQRREPKAILEWGLNPGGYVLFLGRFSPEKGCHLLVEAFEQLRTEVQLVMAGAGSYCDAYSRELRTHAGERIRMLDWVSGAKLDELLTNAMIFVLPSDLEGLSLALLDAMGAGLCVLTSDVPENREVVDGAGFTFRRGDAADLGERLRFLIANPAVREAAGKAARKRISEKYLWENIANDIERVYFDALGLKLPQPESKKANRREAASPEVITAERQAG
jgi:glycosyltransferase involved in cell wall biosynthesis